MSDNCLSIKQREGMGMQSERFGHLLGRLWAKRWVRWALFIWAVVFIGQRFMRGDTALPPSKDANQGQSQLASVAPSQPSAKQANSCAVGTPVGQTVRLRTAPVALVDQPNEKAERVVNKKATQSMGSLQYLEVSRSDLLVEDCKSGEWSQVRPLKVDARGQFSGWVASKSLRERVLSGGVEVFAEDNFEWTKATQPYRQLVVAGVNKIHRTNPRCKDVELSSVELSSSKSTKGNPTFYVTCRDGEMPWNAFFSKSDIENDVSLNGSHIDRSVAVNQCKQAAKARTTNPSTFDFSDVMALSVIDFPNGRTKVESKFKARNALNMESKFRVSCLFERGALIETVITEGD